MSDPQQICPECFRVIALTAQCCPACSADLAQLSARDYGVKLLAALLHPLADVRLRAIIALGLRRDAAAAKALAECALRHPTDLVAGLEIVRSLARLEAGEARAAALSRLMQRHPVHAVRKAVEQTLGAHSS